MHTTVFIKMMYIEWFLRLWLRVSLMLITITIHTNTISADNSAANANDYNRNSLLSSVISQSDQNASLSPISPFDDEAYNRVRRAVVQASLRLIDEKACPEIRNLCTNLRDGADDLPVLECIQTFLSNQVEGLSDECQHAIWSHTGTVKPTELAI